MPHYRGVGRFRDPGAGSVEKARQEPNLLQDGGEAGAEPPVRRRRNLALGKVKWFNDAKGFGFIESHDGKDIFVHYSSIRIEGHRTLLEGQEVEFDLYEGQKGPQAQNVIPRA